MAMLFDLASKPPPELPGNLEVAARFEDSMEAPVRVARKKSAHLLRPGRTSEEVIGNPTTSRAAQSDLHLFKLICPSNVPVPVAVPVAKSIVSNRHHRKRSSGSREPAGSVLDRRNFRNPSRYLVE